MFAVGSPTTLVSPAVRGESVVVALERDARAETTALVTSNSVEIWRGTRRVGGFWRSPATVSSEGAFLCAKWRENRNTLAVVAEGGRVYLYHLQFIENPELVLGVPAVRCDITKRATLRLATPRRAPAGPPPNAATPFPNTSFAPPPVVARYRGRRRGERRHVRLRHGRHGHASRGNKHRALRAVRLGSQRRAE